MQVNVELVARDAGKAVVRGDVVVVVDVLRCTSSIITALANGARSLRPVRTVKEARRIHAQTPRYVLAGERGGRKPKGFALGNSPREFTRDAVEGRDIIITTTSGTAALTRVMDARWVLIGALVNAQVVADAAARIGAKEGRGVSLALAGKRGSFSLEDFLGAGAIMAALPTKSVAYSDAAYASVLAFQAAKASLTTIIQAGSHGQTLQRLGLGEDVVFCTQLNTHRIVPQFADHHIIPLRHSPQGPAVRDESL